jgi:2,3,4,5-tetrahydropyridine-2-carboxylate N-succinyltransferase
MTTTKKRDRSPAFYKPHPPKRSVAKMRALMPAMTALSRADVREYPKAHEIFDDFLAHLEQGSLRCAELQPDGTWQTDHVVREFINVGFRLGDIIEMSALNATFQTLDRHTLPPQQFPDYVARTIRMIATGTARRGARIGNKVTFMNGAYANVGAYVGDETMIDSNALVGSAAQVGQRCHISADVMIAGVLEPRNAEPCVVEDDVFMGAGSMIAEGVVLKRGSALSMGTELHYSTPLFDVVREQIIKPVDGRLYIPENALVVGGNVALKKSKWALKLGLTVPAALIVHYYASDAPMSERRAINLNLR